MLSEHASTKKTDAPQSDTEDIEKAKALQADVDNTVKLNTPPLETEDSTSSNLCRDMGFSNINVS